MSARSRLGLSEAQFEAVSGALLPYTIPFASSGGWGLYTLFPPITP